MTHIPFCDLKAQHRSLEPELSQTIFTVIDECAFIRGKYVDAFESEFAKAIGSPHCISCGNGTDALFLILKALDLKPGDEVITSAHSWIASSEAITFAGGTVVFCDTDPDTFTLCPEDLLKKITPRTKGILPVHLFGHPADMITIMDIANRKQLWVVEDCAQAHLASIGDQKIGTFGIASAFSFYPGKNLGAMGDAGAVLTSDQELCDKITRIARHGGLNKGEHLIEGVNSRMDGIQAAILSVKLPHLSKWTDLRAKHVTRYNQRLRDLEGIHCPVTRPDLRHANHLYVIQVERDRDALKNALQEKGIPSMVHYPTLLPLLPAYRRFNHSPQDFPVAYKHQQTILSLPLYPEMTEAMVDEVCDTLCQWRHAHPPALESV